MLGWTELIWDIIAPLKWTNEGPVPELYVDCDTEPKDSITGDSKVEESTGETAMKPAAAHDVESTLGSAEVPDGTSTDTVDG